MTFDESRRIFVSRVVRVTRSQSIEKSNKQIKKKKKEKEKSIENQTALCVVRGEYEKKEEKRKKGKVVATRLTPCK